MKRIRLLILMIVLSPGLCNAATLYVDGTSGSDSNGGTSLVDAWATIDHGMTQASPGDTVLITGGKYKESVKIYSKGSTARDHITVKNYDENEVILDGSLTATSWSVYSGNIYQTAITESTDKKVDAVVVDYVALMPSVTQTNTNASYTDTTTISGVTITEGQFYQDNSTDILYVWIPGGGSPATHDIGIVRVTPDTSNQYDGIYLWDSGYFAFENLTIRYFGSRGIAAGAGSTSHNNYTNLKIVFNRHTGILTGPNANLTGSEIAWNFLWNWPRGKFNGGTQGGGWGAGVNIDANSTAEDNTIYKNGGEGILTYLNSGNSIMKNNTVYDNWSMNMYVDTAESVVVEQNLVYCTPVDEAAKVNNGFPTDGTVYKGQHPIGIGTAEEFYGGEKLYYLRDVDIRNNIVVNCRRGYSHFAQAADSGMVRIRIVNNTIIVPDYPVPGTVTVGDADNFLGVYLNNSRGANEDNVINNNIIVVGHSRNYALYNRDTDTDTFATYGLSNNLYYNSAYTKPIHWGGTYNTIYDYTLDVWKSLQGTTHGQNSLSVDPNFTRGADKHAASYYIPTDHSPVLEGGVPLSGFNTDFYEDLRTINWSIGAVQKYSQTPRIISIMHMTSDNYNSP